MRLRFWFAVATCGSALACKSAPEAGPSGAPTLTAQELTVTEQDLTDFAVRFEGTVASPTVAHLVKASYELVVDGKTVKSGEESYGTVVPPGGAAHFAVAQRSQYVEDEAALRALGQRGGDLLAAVRGTLTVDADGRQVAVPFAKSREIRLPRLPHVVLNELDFARYSPNEVGGIFYVGVKNPNPFPIRVSTLTYAATINGKPMGDGEIAKGEEVAAASTGVFEVQVNVNPESYGPGVDKLIKTLSLPYRVTGELQGKLYKEPYQLEGEVKLNVSK